MNGELFKKICPKAYYGQYLEHDIRPDGREIADGRGIIISKGYINTADGSSFVRVGETGILCGLKLEFLDAKEVDTTSGSLEVNVIMTPLSNPNFFIGKPTNQSRYYSEALKNIFEKYVIDLSELYCKEASTIIVIHADLLCIDYEGSIIDACCIALLSALFTLQMPTISLKDGIVNYDYENTQQLSILDIPVSITFGFFDDFEVMDPDVFEEGLIDDTITFVLGSNNKFLSILKPGGKLVEEKIIDAMKEKTKERYASVYDKIDAFRNSLSVEMNEE